MSALRSQHSLVPFLPLGFCKESQGHLALTSRSSRDSCRPLYFTTNGYQNSQFHVPLYEVLKGHE